jgi:TetR/AcrR family transcriptional repressor of nem operon
VGRPPEFDRDVILDRAMRVFWAQGYEATSVDRLVARLGIQRGSLYGAFGDKRTLFLAALDHYDRTMTGRLIAVLEDTPSGMEAIRRFFALKVKLASEPGRPRGCLLTNSTAELASRDRGAAARMAGTLAKIEEAFYRAVVRARHAGEIGASRSPRALARFLTSSAQGLSIMAKASADRAVLEDVVRVTLAVVETTPTRPRRARAAGRRACGRSSRRSPA